MIYNFHNLPYRDRMAIRTLEAKAARSRRPDMSVEVAYLREALTTIEALPTVWQRGADENLEAVRSIARQALQEKTND